MKKNRMMRLASVLLVCVLLTTSVISGTFAKYVTSTSSNDQARVAVWGINADSVVMDLFDNTYDSSVNANDGDNVIAPGTAKQSQFSIVTANATLAPEVDYNITIDLTGTTIASSIKNNPNIKWKLDSGEWGTWDQLMTSILRLSGDTTVTYSADKQSVTKKYEANAVATEFANGKTHTIYWKWMFDQTVDGAAANDANDTAMGNSAVEQDIWVKLVIKVTAEQVD